MECDGIAKKYIQLSQRSPRKQMEGSDYEGKCSQRADDVGRMSNHGKRKVSPRKEKNRGES